MTVVPRDAPAQGLDDAGGASLYSGASAGVLHSFIGNEAGERFGAAVAASKVALKAAIQYATERRQFNASSHTEEEVLLDYQRHQKRQREARNPSSAPSAAPPHRSSPARLPIPFR